MKDKLTDKVTFRFITLIVIFSLVSGCNSTPLIHAPISNEPSSSVDEFNSSRLRPGTIAMLLPMTGPLAAAGKIVLGGFLCGYYESSDRPVLKIIDTGTTNIESVIAQLKQVRPGLVIGPLSHDAVDQMVQKFDADVPWLMLNDAKGELKNKRYYQFGLSASDEAEEVARQLWSSGYRSPLLIVNDSSLANRVLTTFQETWKNLGGYLVNSVVIKKADNENKKVASALLIDESQRRARELRRLLGRRLEFNKRRRNDIDMVFVMTTEHQIKQIKPALDFYFAANLPVFSLSSFYNRTSFSYGNRDLDGIYLMAMPWQTEENPLTNNPETSSEKRKVPGLEGLYAFGMDIYHIYPELLKMEISPEFFIKGRTGTLFMKGQKVERHLFWARFSGGKPERTGIPEKVF